MPDHTCFTRLPTSRMWDSLAPGPAGEEPQKQENSHHARPHAFYSTADKQNVGQLGSRPCRGRTQKQENSYHARSHVFYSTADKQNVGQFGPRPCRESPNSGGGITWNER